MPPTTSASTTSTCGSRRDEDAGPTGGCPCGSHGSLVPCNYTANDLEVGFLNSIVFFFCGYVLEPLVTFSGRSMSVEKPSMISMVPGAIPRTFETARMA